jgi:hypothetical protein
MIRVASQAEQEEEAKAQNIMFKMNVILFFGTIAAIRFGNLFFI